MTGSMAAWCRSSLLIYPWTPRFRPERKTRLSLVALWPMYRLSTQACLISTLVVSRIFRTFDFWLVPV